MSGLFEAVRRACTPDQWSQGVRIVRAGGVGGERRDDDEIVVRVTGSGPAALKVTLYLDDFSWDCECGRHDGCDHVAAAAIALRRSDESGEALPAAQDTPGRIEYRLRRLGDGIHFERGVRVDGEFVAIEATLDAVSSGRVAGPRFAATRADLAVEVALGSRRRGRLDRGTLHALLAPLARCETVSLDGEPVRTSTDPVVPVARVEDCGDGFRVIVGDPPDVRETLGDGIVRVGDTLRPIGAPALTARESEDFVRGRVFPSGEVASLVAEILPALRARLPVEIATDRLPEVVRERPRIVLDLRTDPDGDALTALATLVYGDPPRARIDGGTLHVLAPGPLPLRDEDAERALVRRLGETLGLAPGIAETFVGEAGVAFARRAERWTGEIRGEGRERFALAPPLRPRVHVEDDGFDVVFEVEPDADRRSASARRGPAAADVVRAWREGATLVALPDGGWSPLPADWMSRFGARVADLLAAREAAGRLPAAALPDLAGLCTDLDLPPPPGFERLRALVDGFEAIPRAPLADGLDAVLREYQRRGADWLAFHRDAGTGALLADDMGLGKTVQALAAIRGRTLVVAPTSVVVNWRDEAARFRPSLRVSIYHGRDRALDPAADVTVTSYALLRLDRDALAAVDWDTVVLDESQAIKNPDSQVARAAFELRAGFRLAMTGTPVENRLDELWSQFHFLDRGLLGGLSDFQRRYARPIAAGEVEPAVRLRGRIRPFVLRRMKSEVAPELPPRTDVVLHAELDDDERAVYDAVRAATRDEVVRRLSAGGGVLEALEALLRLRQAACHRGLVPGQDAAGSSKVAVLLEALDTVVAEGHRALVFSQWTSLLDRVEPHLAAADLPWLRLDGSTVDRAGVVARFQDPSGPPVLLISLRAGGAGLNLTAADHVFLLDPWWNPAVEDQAADRAHRIGQDRPVMVYRVVAVDTVEERILALQERKRALAEAATGGGVGAGTLTRDDLLALLD